MFPPTNKWRALGSFVNTGYKGWNNVHEKQTLHIDNKYHNDATKEASGIIAGISYPHQTSDTLKERQKTYPKIVEALATIIHLFVKQSTAYKGTEEKANNSDTVGNPGNFVAIVWEVVNYYPLYNSWTTATTTTTAPTTTTTTTTSTKEIFSVINIYKVSR